MVLVKQPYLSVSKSTLWFKYDLSTQHAIKYLYLLKQKYLSELLLKANQAPINKKFTNVAFVKEYIPEDYV